MKDTFLLSIKKFAEKYPAGDVRKRAVDELQRSLQQSTSQFSKWVNSSNTTTASSFVVALEIARRGKPFTDGEYIKECFMKMSEELFRDFKNKNEIIKKLKICQFRPKLFVIEPLKWQQM